MSISSFQFHEMQARLAQNAKRTPEIGAGEPVADELPLHRDIMAYCDRQNPRWLYIHHRTDKRSGIQKGAPDFFVLLPGKRVAIIECKKKDGKRSTDQTTWAYEASLLGHGCFLVRSMDDFLAVINT